MTDFFSERYGLINDQEKNYSEAFRSAVVTSFFNQYSSLEAGELFGRLKDAMDLFGIEQKPQVNDMATLKYNMEQAISYFKSCEWNHLFDFVEYVLILDPKRSKTLADKYNRIFRMHGCKYRLIDGKAVPIVDELEIQEISKALHTGVKATDTAYSEALALLSEKPDPDYNAVAAKASNALESMILTIAKDNEISEETLGRALNALTRKGVSIDSRMMELIKTTYKYVCNSGIRHGGTDLVIATEEDAVFTLVICAAAINYLNTVRSSNVESNS